jgi:hypothetical protein
MSISLLRPLLIKDIHTVDGLGSTDFKEWISRGSYQISQITNNSEIELFVSDPASLVNALVSDSSKLCCIALESMEGVVKNTKFPKSTSWVAIRLYYAAFFAAHSIMRMFGISCSFLEKGHIKIIDQLASITGANGSLRLEGGYFHTVYNPNSNILKLKRLKDSHSDTWTIFYNTLNTLSNDVLRVRGITFSKQQLSAYLHDLAESLTNRGRYPKGNWLSNHRNAVNYRHEFGGWFPYSKNSISYDNIESSLNIWKQKELFVGPSLNENNELIRFFSVTSRIVQLCKLIEEDVDRICICRKSIHHQLPLAFLKFGQI